MAVVEWMFLMFLEAADDLLAVGIRWKMSRQGRTEVVPGRDVANALFCSQNGQINRKPNSSAWAMDFLLCIFAFFFFFLI